MIGQNFTTTANYSDATTLGRYGYPVQVLVSCDQPVFMQFAEKHSKYASRVIWQQIDVPFPPGDYRFAECYGIRFKTNGGTPAAVYAISVFKEDPIVQGFSPST